MTTGRTLLLLATMPTLVSADWSGLNGYAAIAEMRIDSGRIAVHLRLTEKGLQRFAKPPVADSATGNQPEDVALSLLTVRKLDGQPLEPHRLGFRRVETDSQRATPLAGGTYEVDWEYPIAGPVDTLRIEPRMGSGADDLGLIALHRGVPVSDLIALDKPVTLIMDQADPWRSHYDDSRLIRRHAEPRSYVYVEPYEVRHEVLIRLADLIPLIDAGLKTPSVAEAVERPALKQKIGEFLLAKNPLLVSGVQLKPQLDRAEFVAFGRGGMVPVADDQPVEVATALVGVVIVYLTEQPAQSVSLRWDLFSSNSADRAVSVIHGKETFDGYMTAAAPVFEWSRDETFGPLPVATEAPDNMPVMQTAQLSDEQLRAVLQSLLHNAYRAFQLREEEAVYDRLAKSLDDPLLEDIYLQQRRAQLQQAKGLGGEGRVERIDVLDVKRIPAARGITSKVLSRLMGQRTTAGLDVEAHWKAQGEVSHWGHAHKRDNLYAARLTLHRDQASNWKVAALHFLDGQRLDMAAQR